MKYKGVVFDFYDTLCRVDEDIFVSGRKKVAHELNVDFDLFYKKWKSFGRKNITGEIASTQDRMKAVLNSLGIAASTDNIKRFAQQCDDSFYKAAEPYPETRGTVNDLNEKGLNLYILSNASSNVEIIEKKFSHILKSFDAIYFSCFHGLAKPDIRFYNKLIKEQDMDPGEYIYCGDGNDRELDIATDLGFTAVKVEHQVMASYRFGESSRFAHTIPDLSFLKTLIDKKE